MQIRWRTASLLVSASVCALGGCDRVGSDWQVANWLSRGDRGQVHLARGQSLAKRGDLDAALAELREAIEANPDLERAHTAIGDIHRRRGDPEQARDAYESACRTDPYAFRPHYNLGLTYQLLAAAALAVEKAHQHLRNAVRVYIRAVILKPDDFETHLNLSTCYCRLGKYNLAENYCRSAIRIQPQSPKAYSNLGIILDRRERFQEAIKAYHASLELDVDQPDLLVKLGSTYLRQGRTQPALRSFATAVKQDAKNALAWEYLGLCRFRLRQYEPSLAAYRNAVSLAPKNATVQRSLGVVTMTLFLLSPARTELRERRLARVALSLALDPDQPDLSRLLRKYTPPLTGPGLKTPER